MRKSVAIVEDEPAIRDNYAAALRHQGYDVSTFGRRGDALLGFKQRLPDLVIVDIGLGEEVEGGFELCRELRGLSATLPIIFLTARDSDLDAISGFRLGADDYLTKDISLPHLLARVAALLRRVDAMSAPSTDQALLERGSLTLDLDRMSVQWKTLTVPLTVTEFWIVHALVQRPGHVKTRAQLMRDAHVFVDDSTITSHVKRVRRKFEQADPDFACIDTIYGMGYCWSIDP